MTFEVLAVEANRGVARWHTNFMTVPAGEPVQLDGILIAEFEGPQHCRVFREWWHQVPGRTGHGVRGLIAAQPSEDAELTRRRSRRRSSARLLRCRLRRLLRAAVIGIAVADAAVEHFFHDCSPQCTTMDGSGFALFSDELSYVVLCVSFVPLRNELGPVQRLWGGLPIVVPGHGQQDFPGAIRILRNEAGGGAAVVRMGRQAVDVHVAIGPRDIDAAYVRVRRNRQAGIHQHRIVQRIFWRLAREVTDASHVGRRLAGRGVVDLETEVGILLEQHGFKGNFAGAAPGT